VVESELADETLAHVVDQTALIENILNQIFEA